MIAFLHLPVSLAVVAGTVTRTDLASGVATFVACGTGMGLVLVAVAVARTAVVKRRRLASRPMDRWRPLGRLRFRWPWCWGR